MTETRHRLRTAIIGTGKVAPLHAAALASLPESDFVAVCGRPSERLRRFADAHRVRAYHDLAGMIRVEGVHAVIVCTPHPQHAEAAVATLRSGVHTLVEKPLASSLADCDAMLQAAEDGGALLGTVSQRRFYPPCARIRDAIDRGAIGTPALGIASVLGWRDEAYYASDPWRGSWTREGGGVLVNQAAHQIDLLLWYMGEAIEISGIWGNLNHPYIEVDDTAVASVRFKSGGVGSIVASNSQNPGIGARVSVHGSNGVSLGVQTDGGSLFIAGVTGSLQAPFNDLWTAPADDGALARWKALDEEEFKSEDPTFRYHRLQVSDFLRAAIERRPPTVTGGDGRRVVELFTAIYESSRTGRSVRLPLASC